MTDITRTFDAGDQSNIQAMADNNYASINDCETKAALIASYLPTVGNVCTDQNVLDELTSRIGNAIAAIQLLHQRLNFTAYKTEQYLSQSTGQYHSNPGTYHSDSGGMSKGNP